MSDRKYTPVFFKTDPLLNKLSTLLPIHYKGVCVPANYRSGSLTKLLRKYPPNCLRAAIIYDFICGAKCVPRKLGAEHFYKILRLDGASKIRARWYWLLARAIAIITLKR